MEPRAPTSVRAKAMESLKGMKFMQRREEAARVAAHARRLEEQKTEAAAPASAAAPRSVAAVPSSSSPRAPTTRIFLASALPVATGMYTKARSTFGMGAVLPAPPLPSSAGGDGIVGGPETSEAASAGLDAAPPASSASARRFYPSEGDRAPPMPRRAGQRTDGRSARATGGDDEPHTARRPPLSERQRERQPTHDFEDASSGSD